MCFFTGGVAKVMIWKGSHLYHKRDTVFLNMQGFSKNGCPAASTAMHVRNREREIDF